MIKQSVLKKIILTSHLILLYKTLFDETIARGKPVQVYISFDTDLNNVHSGHVK